MIKKVGIITLSLIAILLVTLIILNSTKSDNAKKVLTLKTAHTYVLNDTLNKSFEIPLCFDSLLNDYGKEKQIKAAYITDLKEENKLGITLKKIIDNGKRKYQNETYYSLIYTFELMKIYSDIVIEDAYLLLESNNSDLKISIGSFNLIFKENIAFENDISLDGLYCITGSENKKIDGFVLKLSNKSIDNITITRIFVNQIDVHISGDDIIAIKDDVTYNTPIADILGYDYSFIDNKYCENINIKLQNNLALFIPLKYSNSVFFNNSPIIIEYRINNEDYEMVIDNYLFFDNGYNLEEEASYVYEKNIS